MSFEVYHHVSKIVDVQLVVIIFYAVSNMLLTS